VTKFSKSTVFIVVMTKLGALISVLLSLLFHLRVADAKPAGVQPPVGQVYYLATTDLLGEELIGGATVLILNNTQDCFVCNKSEIIDDDSSYFENTEAFYSSIAESSNLGAALKRDFTLGFTLDQTTRSISQSNRTVKGSTLNVLSKVGHCVVKPECIFDESYHTLSQHFVSEFENLPRSIELPGGKLNFTAYEKFLNEFGSHVVTGVTYGSRMYQHCFSQSEEDYDERNFTVRACVAFSGGTDVTKMNISTCAGITREEAEASSSLEVSTRLVIRGGTKETRAKLYAERTSELISQFLTEASWEEPIEYSFTAVWTLLGQRYMGTEHYAKVRHLEGYYLGLKNFDCPLIMQEKPDGSGWAMQGFAETDYSTADVPSYRCYIPYTGCHDNDDCHYGPGIYCQCKGYTCFKDKTLTLNTGEQRLSVVPQWDSYWKWQGCHLDFFSCDCENSNAFIWRTIWEQDKDGADNGKMLRALHSKMLSINRHAASAPKGSKNSKEEL